MVTVHHLNYVSHLHRKHPSLQRGGGGGDLRENLSISQPTRLYEVRHMRWRAAGSFPINHINGPIYYQRSSTGRQR